MVLLVDVKKFHNIIYAPLRFSTRMSRNVNEKKRLKKHKVNNIIKIKCTRNDKPRGCCTVFTR